MRVLVTGANGFSGRVLVPYLAARGHEVIAFTRRAPAPSGGSVRAIQGDLTRPETIPPGYDAVVHTASTSPAEGITEDDIVRDNVVAMRSLVAHAVQQGARTFIFFSSLSRYGRIDDAEVDEATPTRDPDVYGMTKALGEALLAARAVALPSLALRLPAVIGAGAHRNWPSATLARILRGEAVTIFNPDAPFNNAVHVADLAALVETLLARPLTGHDAVTLGAAGTIPVREAVERIMLGCGRRVEVKTSAERRSSFTVTSRRAVERYGYRPMEIGQMLERFGRERPPPG